MKREKKNCFIMLAGEKKPKRKRNPTRRSAWLVFEISRPPRGVIDVDASYSDEKEARCLVQCSKGGRKRRNIRPFGGSPLSRRQSCCCFSSFALSLTLSTRFGSRSRRLDTRRSDQGDCSLPEHGEKEREAEGARREHARLSRSFSFSTVFLFSVAASVGKSKLPSPPACLASPLVAGLAVDPRNGASIRSLRRPGELAKKRTRGALRLPRGIEIEGRRRRLFSLSPSLPPSPSLSLSLYL